MTFQVGDYVTPKLGEFRGPNFPLSRYRAYRVLSLEEGAFDKKLWAGLDGDPLCLTREASRLELVLSMDTERTKKGNR